MKKNRKMLSVLLVLGLLIVGVLTACGGSEESSGASGNTGGDNAAEELNQEGESEDLSTDDELAFFDGKRVTLIVATEPGGGYDAYARLLAPHLEEQLPGSSIIVKNVPGAGHIIGANEIYNSKADGLTFGTFNKGLITNQVVEMEGIRFDLKEMSWLGSPATEPRLFVVGTTAPFETIEDVISGENEVILSSAGVGSSAHTDAMILDEILGFPQMKLVPGYSGTEGELAMMRGEVHGQIGSIDSMLPLVENGDARVLLVIGDKRLEEFPDVPTLAEITPDESMALADLMVSQGLISRPYAGPPGIPEERLSVLREAFEKAWADPDLKEEAERTGRPISFLSGTDTERLIKSAVNQPPEVVELLKEIIVEE